MKYHKIIRLKDGRKCILRNGEAGDGQAALANFILTHGQTDYLLTYPDENTMTAEQESRYLKEKADSEREAEILAEVDGAVAGLAGIAAAGGNGKIRHRADFGISIDRRYWNLGIGTALMSACIECAERAGYEQIELNVVAENVTAIEMYRKAGFEEFGRNPRGFRSRHSGYQELVYMRMELNGQARGMTVNPQKNEGRDAVRAAVSDREVAQILDILRKRGELATTVESLTAGMIAARLADIPGSSDVLRRAFVTYSDEAKHEMVGVDKATLEKYTAVSRRTAEEMAEGGAQMAGAAACVSATGYAGPPWGPEDTTVGLVYLGCCYRGKTVTEEHRYSGSRNEVRAQAMNDALRLLARCLSDRPASAGQDR